MAKKLKKITLNREPLTKESVIKVAVKLADDGGIESLSMRKLGKALGVEGMAIYYHFANKEVLIDGMVDSIHAEVKLPSDKQNWRSVMQLRSESYLTVLSKHSWAAPILENRQNPGHASLQLVDSTIHCLLKAGFSIDMVAHIISVLDAYTIGFAQQLRSPTENIEKEVQMGEDIMAQFPFDLYPHVGQLITEHVAKSGYRSIEEFEFGLNLILDGIVHLN